MRGCGVGYVGVDVRARVWGWGGVGGSNNVQRSTMPPCFTPSPVHLAIILCTTLACAAACGSWRMSLPPCALCMPRAAQMPWWTPLMRTPPASCDASGTLLAACTESRGALAAGHASVCGWGAVASLPLMNYCSRGAANSTELQYAPAYDHCLFFIYFWPSFCPFSLHTPVDYTQLKSIHGTAPVQLTAPAGTNVPWPSLATLRCWNSLAALRIYQRPGQNVARGQNARAEHAARAQTC